MRHYIALLLLALLTPQVLASTPTPRAIVSVGEDGVAVVRVEVQLSEGLNEVPLPVEPVELTVEVEPADVTWVCEGLTLYLLSPRNLTAVVTYVANVTAVGGVLVLHVAEGARVRVELRGGVALLSVPENVLSYERLDGGAVAIELLGPVTLEYTLVQGTATPPTPAVTPTSTPQTTPPPPTAIPAAMWIVVAVAIAALAVATAILARRSRS